MKKKYLLFSLFLITVLATVTTTKVNSKITSPPAGSSGDPITNASCSQGGCHPGPAQTPSLSDLTINIGTGVPSTPLDNTFVYDGNTVYNIAFLPNAFTGRYGFQIVALDASNNQAGTFTVTNAATTKINTSVGTGTRQYMGHLQASTTKNWVFRWTSPSASTGCVTFYYSYNTADDDDTSLGDIIYKGSVTICANPSGVEDIANKISSLNIFPNPISNEFRISFELKEANTVSAQLYSLDGKICKELLNEKHSEENFNRSFNTDNIPSGIYLLKLNVGNASVTKKVMKL